MFGLTVCQGNLMLAKVKDSEDLCAHNICILPWFRYNYLFFFCWQFEPIYGTPYQKTNLSSSLVDYWSTDNNATSSFHLPGKNQFFPRNLSLLKAQENASKDPVEIPIDSKYDQRFQENSATSILLSLPPQTFLVSHCGGCRTLSSVSLVSTSTVISTHQMLRTLQHGLVGSETITLIVYLIKLWCSIIYGR